jgi:hypothetical protein
MITPATLILASGSHIATALVWLACVVDRAGRMPTNSTLRAPRDAR